MRGGSSADSESVITLTHTSPIFLVVLSVWLLYYHTHRCLSICLSVCLLGISLGGGVAGTGEAEGGAEQHPETQ